jgi:uncharacterized repeat protein (TIGR01451 family)
MLRISTGKILGKMTSVRKHPSIGRCSTRRHMKTFGRHLRLEHLENRSLLSLSAGSPALESFANISANVNGSLNSVPALIANPVPVQLAMFHTTLNSIVSIPDLGSSWVGYDIDASSLPEGALIKTVYIHQMVQHQREGDLQIKLYNDSGSEWLIRQNKSSLLPNINEILSDSKALSGKPVGDVLHYRVRDTVAGKTGALQSLEIWVMYEAPLQPPATRSDLTVTGTHAGNFTQGQTGASYTINVTNSGNGPTSGLVSVQDILPAGLTATAISGAGWTTNLGTLSATRSDALSPGASYDPIIVTVDVAANAPASVINTVQVSGGGETNIGNNSYNDPTSIIAVVQNPTIVGENLSVTNARDGQTITVGYQISSGAAASLSLNCTIVGPGGEVVNAADSDPVVVMPGTSWYTRSFFINLPPKALTGFYDVTWKIHGATTGDDSVTQADALTIEQPISLALPTLMYHNICTDADFAAHPDLYSTSLTQFTEQMQALKAYGYTAVTLQDVMDYRAGVKTPPAKPILLSFDDAYESLLTLALPVLTALDFKATAFIPTVGVRSDTVPGGWYSDALSWTEIKTLHNSGRIDVESHTKNHLDCTTLTPEALMAELADSRNIIEQHLNEGVTNPANLKRVSYIAYPYGKANDAVKQAAWQAGYTAAMSAFDGLEATCADKYFLQRFQMDWVTSVWRDTANPTNFLFQDDWGYGTLPDADVVVPKIAITGIQYLNPVTKAALDINNIQPGQSVLVRVNANNSGPDATVISSLALDSDANHAAVDYNSHPGQDVQVLFPWGPHSFEWTVTVPNTVGQYYSWVTFHDVHYVLGFQNSGWKTAFQVQTATPLTLTGAALAQQATASKSVSATSISDLKISATDAVYAQIGPQKPSVVAQTSTTPKQSVVAPAIRWQSQHPTKSVKTPALYDAVLGYPGLLHLSVLMQNDIS